MHFVSAKSILSAGNGMNLYRGCAHGCIYCDSRSACYHMEHPFEDIEAKVYGVICFGMGLTLREGNREYFYRQLDKKFPGLKDIYINKYGTQYVVSSPRERYLMKRFHKTCAEQGLLHDVDAIFCYLQSFEAKTELKQLSLWED